MHKVPTCIPAGRAQVDRIVKYPRRSSTGHFLNKLINSILMLNYRGDAEEWSRLLDREDTTLQLTIP